MKKFTKGMLAVCALTIMFFVGACTANTIVTAEQEHPLKIWFQNQNNRLETWVVVDEDTGVNYIVISSTPANGYPNSGRDVTITPRLKSTGGLYVSQ